MNMLTLALWRSVGPEVAQGMSGPAIKNKGDPASTATGRSLTRTMDQRSCGSLRGVIRRPYVALEQGQCLSAVIKKAHQLGGHFRRLSQ